MNETIELALAMFGIAGFIIVMVIVIVVVDQQLLKGKVIVMVTLHDLSLIHI